MDAALYCNWLSVKTARSCYYKPAAKKKGVNGGEIKDTKWEIVADSNGYRLPTEAEWEYGCRSGTTAFYSSGNQEALLRKYGNFLPWSEQRITQCGDKLPNGYGLFDMHGNVWEWCHDWQREYDEGDDNDPQSAEIGSSRVYRGGCYVDAASDCRSMIRNKLPLDRRDGRLGFRVAAVPSSQ